MPRIIPIDDLKNTLDISDMCHKKDEPIYITKNGYGDMVLMSIEMYEETMKQVDLSRSIEISKEQVRNGQVRENRESLDMKKRYDL